MLFLSTHYLRIFYLYPKRYQNLFKVTKNRRMLALVIYIWSKLLVIKRIIFYALIRWQAVIKMQLSGKLFIFLTNRNTLYCNQQNALLHWINNCLAAAKDYS